MLDDGLEHKVNDLLLVLRTVDDGLEVKALLSYSFIQCEDILLPLRLFRAHIWLGTFCLEFNEEVVLLP